MIGETQYIALITFVVLGTLIPCLLPVLIHKKFMRLKALPLFTGAGVFILFVIILEALMHVYVLKINTSTMALLETHGYMLFTDV
jgi:uncharacterized membrane protein YhfC